MPHTFWPGVPPAAYELNENFGYVGPRNVVFVNPDPSGPIASGARCSQPSTLGSSRRSAARRRVSVYLKPVNGQSPFTLQGVEIQVYSDGEAVGVLAEDGSGRLLVGTSEMSGAFYDAIGATTVDCVHIFDRGFTDLLGCKSTP